MDNNFNDLSKEERLVAVCNRKVANYPKLKASLAEGKTNERLISMTFSGDFERLALKAFFIDGDIRRSKLYFYNGGLLDVLLTTKYTEKVLDYGTLRFGYAMLSDSRELIDQWANLKHSNYDTMIDNGSSTLVYVMQCLVKEDWNEFERTMEILRTKSVPKLKIGLDAAIFTAIAEKKKKQVEQVLAEFVSPKVHNARNKHQGLIGEFISQPAIVYAKLAWLKGIEVSVKSPLVPNELLPTASLPEYHKIDLLSEETGQLLV